MSKLDFEASVTIRVTPERAFDFFADHRNVARVLEGVSRWDPLGERTEGVGARYEVEMVALGVPLRNVLVLNAWERPRRIGWASESGLIRQTGGFRFRPTDDGGVRVTLRISYEPPGGTVGAVVAKRLEGLVRARLEHAMEEIKVTLEG